MQRQKRKIGEILLEKEFITERVLEEALRLHRESGVSLTEYLIINNHITEIQLAKALAEQFKLPYLSVAAYSIPKEVIELVPVDIAEKYWLIPIDKVKNILTVAMSNPLDMKAIKELEGVTGCVVQPFVSLISDIQSAIKDYYCMVIRTRKEAGRKGNCLSGGRTEERRVNKRVKSPIIFHTTLCGLRKQRSINISRDGLLMESDKLHPLKKVFTILLTVPDSEPVDCKARVVWVAPRRKDACSYKLGIQFLDLSPEDKEKLTAAIERHKTGASSRHLF